LKYVFVTIGLLKKNFANFIAFEDYMLDDEVKNIYLKYHNGDELCYEKNINYLFRNARGSIEKKLQTFFPINTLDVINTQDKVALVLYDYADAFMIKDETCNINEKKYIILNNETNPFVMDLEDMNEEWEKVTLLSFCSKKRFL